MNTFPWVLLLFTIKRFHCICVLSIFEVCLLSCYCRRDRFKMEEFKLRSLVTGIYFKVIIKRSYALLCAEGTCSVPVTRKSVCDSRRTFSSSGMCEIHGSFDKSRAVEHGFSVMSNLIIIRKLSSSTIWPCFMVNQ